MKILMATDGSKEAETALRGASRLLKHPDVPVDVLCVAPNLPQSSSKATLHQFREKYRRRAQRILNRAHISRCTEGLRDVRLMSEMGSPARVIADLANDYDPTVIGAKGRDGHSQGGLGPVTNLVVNHLTGALFVGRAMRGDRGARILVALDGSAASLEALETLTSLFDLNSAEVTLMHVVESPWLHLGHGEEWDAESEETGEQSVEEAFLGELRSEALQLIERARSQLLAQHAAVNTLVEEGNPATELLSEADTGEYDLIVVGGAGLVDLKHKIMGSVSAKIVWDAPCSVLLVKSEP